MKILATKFNAQGHYFRQIWRGTDVAIYERSLSVEHPPHELELVIIGVVPKTERSFGGPVRITEEHEAYPSSSAWGRLGWSFPIRYKDWVLGLGIKLLAISKARAGFVRHASHELWLQTVKHNGGAF